MAATHSASRRRFLVTGAALVGTMALAACGDDDDPSTVESEGGDGDGGTGAAGSLVVAQFFGGPLFVAGQPLRAPIGVADADGLLPVADAPAEVVVQVLDADDQPVGDPVTVARHAEGLPRPYYPFETVAGPAGFYTARVEADGQTLDFAFQVQPADEIRVIQPGARLPELLTPTTADARGVTPICTADPVCALHERAAAEVVAAGQPLALLVSTPAFCQIAICGPVLDVLLAGLAEHPEVQGVHAEVYADPGKDLDTYAPTTSALGLHFEPCLVLVGSDGVVARRLDTIYDAVELDAALAALS